MKEINFYQIDDVITKSLAPLLMKVMEDKKKALIFCPDGAKFKEIDDSLWTYGKHRFIPHVTFADKQIDDEFGFERQPILLDKEEKNLNKADYLVLIDVAGEDFIKTFSRVFYFYEPQDLDKVRKFAKKFTKVNAYKKADGKWVKDGL